MRKLYAFIFCLTLLACTGCVRNLASGLLSEHDNTDEMVAWYAGRTPGMAYAEGVVRGNMEYQRLRRYMKAGRLDEILSVESRHEVVSHYLKDGKKLSRRSGRWEYVNTVQVSALVGVREDSPLPLSAARYSVKARIHLENAIRCSIPDKRLVTRAADKIVTFYLEPGAPPLAVGAEIEALRSFELYGGSSCVSRCNSKELRHTFEIEDVAVLH